MVQIGFDPAEVSYADLLRVFFTIHDPTTQRIDKDMMWEPQYRSIILTHSDEQRQTALAVVKEITDAKIWPAPIVTQVEPLRVFYEAEPEHHDYFARNPWTGYCQAVVAPKEAKFRKDILPDWLKSAPQRVGETMRSGIHRRRDCIPRRGATILSHGGPAIDPRQGGGGRGADA